MHLKKKDVKEILLNFFSCIHGMQSHVFHPSLCLSFLTLKVKEAFLLSHGPPPSSSIITQRTSPNKLWPKYFHTNCNVIPISWLVMWNHCWIHCSEIGWNQKLLWHYSYQYVHFDLVPPTLLCWLILLVLCLHLSSLLWFCVLSTKRQLHKHVQQLGRVYIS